MNNFKKISIVVLFIFVFSPFLTFAANTAFPTGTGYNDSQFNGTALQDPNKKNTTPFPTGTGYTGQFNGTALQAPSSNKSNTSNSNDKTLVTCGGLDSNGKPQPDCVAQDVVDITQKIMNLAFISAGFIVAIMFMYAGFLLITSAGDTGKIQKAKNIFKRTVIGFIIMYLSYILVLNTLTRIGAADFFKNIIK